MTGEICNYSAIAHGPTQDPTPQPGSPALEQGRVRQINPRRRSEFEFQAEARLQREARDAWPRLKRLAAEKGFLLPRKGPPKWQNFKLLGESLKVVKGLKLGVATAVLYLSPSDEAWAVNLCSDASEECRAACLGHAAGQLATPDSKNARIWKTIYFALARPLFDKVLDSEISSFERKAKERGLIPAVRFDGSSDTGYGVKLAAKFPGVMFYDYTKHPNHALNWLEGRYPENVHLTFSFSGHNKDAAKEILSKGGNVAVVFDSKPAIANKRCAEAIPAWWEGFPVLDADDTDVRFQDPPGHVAGLRFKQTRDRERAAVRAGEFVRPGVRSPWQPRLLPTAKENPGGYECAHCGAHGACIQPGLGDDPVCAACEEQIRRDFQPSCHACGGEAHYVGTLGRRAHYRCRACGAESSEERRNPAICPSPKLLAMLPAWYSGKAVFDPDDEEHDGDMGHDLLEHLALCSSCSASMPAIDPRFDHVGGRFLGGRGRSGPGPSLRTHHFTAGGKHWLLKRPFGRGVRPGHVPPKDPERPGAARGPGSQRARGRKRPNPWTKDGYLEAGLTVYRPGLDQPVWEWVLGDWDGETQKPKQIRDALRDAVELYRTHPGLAWPGDRLEARYGSVVTVYVVQPDGSLGRE